MAGGELAMMPSAITTFVSALSMRTPAWIEFVARPAEWICRCGIHFSIQLQRLHRRCRTSPR